MAVDRKVIWSCQPEASADCSLRCSVFDWVVDAGSKVKTARQEGRLGMSCRMSDRHGMCETA